MVEGAGGIKGRPFLDGTNTIAQIAQALSGELSLAATFAAIRRFAAYSVLADGPAALSGGELAFWDALGATPPAVAEGGPPRPARGGAGAGGAAAPRPWARAPGGARVAGAARA